MNCAWKQLLAVLPHWLAHEVDKFENDIVSEIRLRAGLPPQLILKSRTFWLNRIVTVEDLNFCVNTASRYSPWAAQSSADGYITAPGGHRIGLCGSAVLKDGTMTGIQTIRSLCIRIARDFPGIAQPFSDRSGSVLIIGPPGSGKTTLLRDLIRQLSGKESVAVVDERGELFPDSCFTYGKALDVLSGCPKSAGIEKLLRTMGPDTIAVDEITAEEDCIALMQACWCGVRLIATAHASGMDDLRSRPIYIPLMKKRIFDHILVMKRDKTIYEERMIP